MGHTGRYHELDERSRKQLKYRSRTLIGHYGFTISDLEDIEQELYLHLYQQLPKYDPNRSSKATFVDRVLTSGTRDLIRRQTAAKRDYLMCQISLDQPVYSADEEETSLIDTICETDDAFDVGQPPKDYTDKIDLRIEVQRILAKLDWDLQLICLGLADQKTPTEISRELGICRPTFYDRKLRIQKAFEEAGMGVCTGA